MSERDLLIDFVRKNVDEEFDPAQDSLLDIMDSVTFLQLVVFLDQELGVQLDMSMVGLESFANIDALMELVEMTAA
jgi:acyl carrier protein